jgi:hypothetical protein
MNSTPYPTTFFPDSMPINHAEVGLDVKLVDSGLLVDVFKEAIHIPAGLVNWSRRE